MTATMLRAEMSRRKIKTADLHEAMQSKGYTKSLQCVNDRMSGRTQWSISEGILICGILGIAFDPTIFQKGVNS